VAEERAAVEEAQRDAVRERNRGVFWEGTLAPVALDEAAVEARGIRRYKDKVRLPPEAGEFLTGQGAADRNGPMYFEVSVPGTSRRTHAGLLEFTAQPGTVEVPRNVVVNLWGHERGPEGAVRVRYVRLERATFAQLQPLSAGFQADCGDDVRGALEQALLRHATLQVGERVLVPMVSAETGAPAEHEVLCVKLEPEAACSVVDTDVAVDILPSLEFEDAVRRRMEHDRAIGEELDRARAEAAAADEERRGREAAAAAAAAEEAAAREAEARSARARREAAMSAARAALPDEPVASTGAPTVSCRVRLPDGSSHARRFGLDEPLATLFTFVDSHYGRPGEYLLVTQFPRRVVAPGGDGSLRDAGFVAGSEALLVEAAAGGGEGPA